MKHKPQYIVEYLLMVVVAGLVRILPLRAALGLGWLVAAGTHFIGRVKVERTHERIRQVLGEAFPEKEVRRIAWISWRNLFFNAIDALRFSTGAHVGKGVVDRLKRGKVLAILPDIGSKSLAALTVGFLNGQASIAPGAAQFAQLADCPIYPVCMRRIGWTKHTAVMLDPIAPDPALGKSEDQQRIMVELMAAISKEILKTPEQYFWYNKRWVLNPKETK